MATAKPRRAWEMDAPPDGDENLSMEDLRDENAKLREENRRLKVQNADKEDKLKKMATKLLRLTEDLKRRRDFEGAGAGSTAAKGGKPHDRDVDGFIDSLQDKIRERDKQIELLKNKLQYYKGVQNLLQSRKRQFDHVKSKVDTGTTQKKLYPLMFQGPRVLQASPKRRGEKDTMEIPPPTFYDDDEADRLRDLVAELSEKLASEHKNVLDLQAMHESDQRRCADLERRLADCQRNRDQQERVVVPDAGVIEELKNKKMQVAALQSKLESLEAKFQQMKRNHAELLEQTERLNREYKEERRMRVQLQHDAEKYQNAAEQIRDLNVIIDDLRGEKLTLEEEHAKILSTALSGGENKELEVERQLNELREQIKEAEAGRKVAHEQAKEALEKATAVTEELGVVQNTRRELEVKYYELKQENELLSEKLKYFTAESGIDFKELEDALALIRRRKESGEDGELNALELDSRLREAKAHSVELAQELERTQKMLQLQERLGREYQAAIEEKERMLKELNLQLDEKRQDVARVVDRKESRIKELESQVRTLLYRSKLSKASGLPDIELQEGENVLELAVVDTDLDADVLELEDASPLFAIVNFYKHPAQATFIAKAEKGSKAKFDYTMLFVVAVDNTFIGYLYDRPVKIELCRARGLDYHVIATADLTITDLVNTDTEGSEWKLDLAAQNGAAAGSMRISARMRMTIGTSVQAFKESNAIRAALKPFGTTGTPAIHSASHAHSKTGRPMELTMTIGEVGRLELPGRPFIDDKDSSVYCAYQFYFFGLYCTPHSTRSDDHQGTIFIRDTQKFPVQDNADFNQYRGDKTFEILVLEDTQLDGQEDSSESLYGRVDVGTELDKLKIGSPFSGELPIVNEENRTVGHVTVELLLEDHGVGRRSDDDGDGEGDGRKGKKKKHVQIQMADPKDLYGSTDNFIMFTVGELKLEGPALEDEVVQKSDLVVAYDFLCGMYDPNDKDLIETDHKRKKAGLDVVAFNHRKVFPIDTATHDRARWKLKSMLREKEQAVVTFEVEAIHGEEGVSLGHASLDLLKLAEIGDVKDGMRLDVMSDDGTVIGRLQLITVATEALSSVLAQL